MYIFNKPMSISVFLGILLNTLLIFVCIFGALNVEASSEDLGGKDKDVASFSDLVKSLPKASYREKNELITDLYATGDERSVPLFQAFLKGELYQYTLNEVHHVVIRDKQGENKHYIDSLTQLPVELSENVRTKKIRVNNRVRRHLKKYLALLKLNDEDAQVRQNAINNLIKTADVSLLPDIERSLGTETDSNIRDGLILVQGILWTKSDSPDLRFRGVKAIEPYSEIVVQNALNSLLAVDDEGAYVESDNNVIEAAKAALVTYERKKTWYGLVEQFFFGLSAGSVLLLAAVGLAITFGVMGVINMAHGEMIMIGAYCTYVVQLLMPNAINHSLWVAIPVAFLVSGLVGIAIERLIIRHLYGRPLETLLATFGVSLVLQQLVRSVFSPLNRTVITPDWMSGSWQINGMLSMTYNRIYIIFFAILVFIGLVLLLKRTHFGLQMRAVTLNRPMASSMGIRTGRVDALTFGLGSGIAGIAGVAISQLTNVGPNLGQSYIIDSFMVVVFGGVGNLLGTLFGAGTLGLFNKFTEPYLGAVASKILILIAVIIFIQFKPRGMFALKGRFVEN